MEYKKNITFPEYSGIRCLMLPYIQGDPDSVPEEYRSGYEEILESLFFEKGDIGFLTIDESFVKKHDVHRGDRAKCKRALHTEAGRRACFNVWGGGYWGSSDFVSLDPNVKVLLANNENDSCALWDTVHTDTTFDGDIGHLSEEYPYEDAVFMKEGDVYEIGIFTPHESMPMKKDKKRQFLRIISSGVHGRESYFTNNPYFD